MAYQIKYGTSTIHYSLSRSNRKTLAIEVHPDLTVKVIAPEDATVSAIQEKILKRAQWIKKQQHYFEQFLPRTPKRDYVSGETHFYLGRQYLLRVRKSVEPSVLLKSGQLIVKVENPQDANLVKQVLVTWYYNHALKKFHSCIAGSLPKFKNYDIESPQLIIRRMSKRWGSCTPNGRIILNPEIIKAPLKCIEYVIKHELCHLVHHDHGQQFYELQSKVMPDWEKWKLKLESILS